MEMGWSMALVTVRWIGCRNWLTEYKSSMLYAEKTESFTLLCFDQGILMKVLKMQGMRDAVV